MANANSVIRVTDDSGGNMQVFPTLDEAHAAARTGGFLLRQTSEFPPSYMFIKRPDILRNDQITHPVLTVISETGENLGQLRIDEALRRAASANLDLVLVGENPPAARITDFGKFRTEHKKAKKAAQPSARVKQVRFGAFSEDHDIETRFNQVVQFLQSGRQVRIVVHFKRARDFDVDGATATLEYLKSQLSTNASTDGKAHIMPGKGVSMMFSPKKKQNNAPPKANE